MRKRFRATGRFPPGASAPVLFTYTEQADIRKRNSRRNSFQFTAEIRREKEFHNPLLLAEFGAGIALLGYDFTNFDKTSTGFILRRTVRYPRWVGMLYT